MGLSWPGLGNEAPSSLRAMVGNAMAVPLMKLLASQVLKCIKDIDFSARPTLVVGSALPCVPAVSKAQEKGGDSESADDNNRACAAPLHHGTRDPDQDRVQ